MSAVIADPGAAAAPIPRGKKKLLLIVAVLLVVLLAVGGGVVYFLKQRAAHAAAAAAADDESGAGAEHAAGPKIDPKNAPIYLPLDPFVVNLADKEVDRFAQIGITLELDSGVSGEQIKAYMPAIRNAILMVLANKSAKDLNNREGKELLAQEIMREAVRPMGIEMPVPEPVTTAPVEVASAASAGASGAASSAAEEGHVAKPKAVAKRRADGPRNPIQHVHFSSFIIQ